MTASVRKIDTTETSASLLDRAARRQDDTAWQRLVELYGPLIHNWLRRQGVAQPDCDDLFQEVMLVVMRRLPDFRHNRKSGAFRNWLRKITVNCLRQRWRQERLLPRAPGGSDFLDFLAQWEDPDSGISRLWNREHDVYVMRRLLESLQSQFHGPTWSAFGLLTLKQKSAAEVAEQLGISVNAVYIAKSRVLSRLRQEAEGLVD